MFVRTIQKKDPPPCRTEISSSSERVKDSPESMLACSVQSRRKKRRLLFQAFTGVDLILSATAGGDYPLPVVRGKSRKQFEAGANPVNILARFPEFTGDRTPRKMEQELRLHLLHDFGGCALSKQVQIVPRYAMEWCRQLSTGESMDVIALGHQNGQTLPADKPACSGNQDAAHGL